MERSGTSAPIKAYVFHSRPPARQNRRTRTTHLSSRLQKSRGKMNDPTLYQTSNYLQKRDVLQNLDNYASRIKWRKHNRILDIGCGDGSITSTLKQYIPSEYEILGCDKNERMVDYANKYHSNQQTSFTVLDIESDLPECRKESFDHIFSFFTMHWINNQERAFTNIYNLLSPGGDCFIIFMGGAPIYDMYRAMANNNKWSSWMKDVNRYISPYHDLKEPDKVIVKMLENIGYVGVEVQCKILGYAYDSWDKTRKSTMAVNPFKIPKEQHEDFLDDCIHFLLEKQLIDVTEKNHTQTISFNYRLIVVYGQKPSTEIL